MGLNDLMTFDRRWLGPLSKENLSNQKRSNEAQLDVRARSFWERDSKHFLI